jgi:Rps23 Pro-64 3,4-dihydroxylase Tpa1-like proline 4-hydroxylase
VIEPYLSRLKLSLSRMQALSGAFAAAEPFPHVVIDHFLHHDLYAGLLREFPGPGDRAWERFDDAGVQEKKLRTTWRSEYDMPQTTREVCRFLNSGLFLRVLSDMTGIEGLVSDPYYAGGGLGCILPGGLLDVHVDGSMHHGMKLHRRLNALLYLNQEWKSEWGGQLGFYANKDDPEPAVRIDPMGNTLVIFETHDRTYHGHPEPLAAPVPRNSLLLYYYTSEPRPEGQVVYPGAHSALWRERGWRDKWAEQGE